MVSTKAFVMPPFLRGRQSIKLISILIIILALTIFYIADSTIKQQTEKDNNWPCGPMQPTSFYDPLTGNYNIPQRESDR